MRRLIVGARKFAHKQLERQRHTYFGLKMSGRKVQSAESVEVACEDTAREIERRDEQKRRLALAEALLAEICPDDVQRNLVWRHLAGETIASLARNVGMDYSVVRGLVGEALENLGLA